MSERTDTDIIHEMADALLGVAIYFRLEAWERELTDEEMSTYAKVESALDNEFGKVARQTMRDAIERDTYRALAAMEAE